MHYPSIRIEGNILSADLIDLIESGNKHSQDPKDFGFDAQTRVKDEIADAWANARAYWTIYQNKLAKLDENASAISETRNLWIIPLLGMLGYSIDKAEAEIVNNKSYAISHRDTKRDQLPIHIMGWNDQMDKRRAGRSRLSPHATLQEYLNITEHLYGLVSNGKQLRLLRDSSRLIKLTYLEFDLERMFEEELFSDFAILFRLVHASRLPSNQASVSESIIERYHQDALEDGSRIRDGLRDAVENAMLNIANGLLKQSDKNAPLITQIKNGEVTAQQLHHALLRLIYRLLFLMVIEERNLIHTSEIPLAKRNIYFDHYSIARLRRMADKLHLCDQRKTDLWQGLSRTFALFEESGKGKPLGIQPLGSELFRTEGISVLLENHLDNGILLESIRRLSIFVPPGKNQARRINYASFDVEELGSIYESLLELSPSLTPTNFHYKIVLTSSERKQSGSYYTPAPLVQELIKSALVPVLEANITAADTREAKEQAVLQTRICDPACGSGAFLIAAAHHISFRLAQVRAGEDAHAPSIQRRAMRDVVSHCIFGVDINPLSVELCKVSLWLLAVEPGKPLSFLDHHVRCGNSLLGTNPALLEKGIPQIAYKPLTGDTKESCNWMKSLNKDALKNFQDLFTSASSWNQLGNLPNVVSKLESSDDDTIEARAIKETSYQSIVTSFAYLNTRLIADTWCAAFVWHKNKSPNDDAQEAYGTDLTTEHLRKIQKNPHSVSPDLIEKIQAIATEYQFFHWHLEFPAVFSIPKDAESPDFPESGLSGGFDVMLGNPPWERVKLQEKEFFATRDVAIASAPNAATRKRSIAKLQIENPILFFEFRKALRIAEGSSRLLRETRDKKDETGSKSALYPLCGRGDINLYTVFAELFRARLKPTGRMGGVFPSGIASDDTTKFFFRDLILKESLVSLYDFENKKAIFHSVHRAFKFCLLTAGSPAIQTAKHADLAFFCLDPQDLNLPNKRFTLSASDIILLNPNTQTCPIFRTVQDAELTKHIYRLHSIFRTPEKNKNNWKFSEMFHMSNDAKLFITELELPEKPNPSGWESKHGLTKYTPLWEGKMLTIYDHRLASVKVNLANPHRSATSKLTNIELHNDPKFSVKPRYWVDYASIEKIKQEHKHDWIIGFQKVTSPTNERTFITSLIPFSAVGASFPVILNSKESQWKYISLYANLACFQFDYIARQKIGGINVAFYLVDQLPTLLASSLEKSLNVLVPRILELTYTAHDLQPFAEDCSYDGPPFHWDDERRLQLRCELDALFFHLYLPCDDAGNWKPARKAEGAVREETDDELATLKSHFPTPRDAVAYIMETFPIVKKKDIKRTAVTDPDGKTILTPGTYITKTTILDLYDSMLTARNHGKEWTSPLKTPPASFRVSHAPKKPDCKNDEHEELGVRQLQYFKHFFRQTRDEASYPLLFEVIYALINSDSMINATSTNMDETEVADWKQNRTPFPASGFLELLELIENSHLTIDAETLLMTTTDELDAVPESKWVNYNIAVALQAIKQLPNIAEITSTEHLEVTVEIIKEKLTKLFAAA